MTAKRICWNCQTFLRAINPKQSESDNTIFMETLDNANDIPRSENYIFNFEHTIMYSHFAQKSSLWSKFFWKSFSWAWVAQLLGEKMFFVFFLDKWGEDVFCSLAQEMYRTFISRWLSTGSAGGPGLSRWLPTSYDLLVVVAIIMRVTTHVNGKAKTEKPNLQEASFRD